MKIYFMKEDALVYFKNNVENHLTNYLCKDNKWILENYKKLRGEDASPFGEFKLEVFDFKMDMSEKKPENTDYSNVKILYTALRNISDTQASDERFWAGLAHSELWEYMQYRCRFNDNEANSNKVSVNYFFNYGVKRSLIVHSLARLWWVGRLIYDDNAKDPFKALVYLKSDFATKVLTLFSSNFTNNPIIARAILNAVAQLESSGYKIGRKDFFKLIRYVNFLGGIIILDYLSEDELKQKIIVHYCEIKNIFIENMLESAESIGE